MKSLFLKIKPATVLMLLKDSQQSWYPSKLARSSNSSYVHTVNLLGELRKHGVVTLEKRGRQNFYKLTEKGAYLAFALDDFAKKCDAFEQEAKQQAKAEAQSQQAAAASAAAPAQETEQQKAEKQKSEEKR